MRFATRTEELAKHSQTEQVTDGLLRIQPNQTGSAGARSGQVPDRVSWKSTRTRLSNAIARKHIET
jgi:hypothetical protein